MDTCGGLVAPGSIGVMSIGSARWVEAGSRSASFRNSISWSWCRRGTTATASERFKCSTAFFKSRPCHAGARVLASSDARFSAPARWTL